MGSANSQVCAAQGCRLLGPYLSDNNNGHNTKKYCCSAVGSDGHIYFPPYSGARQVLRIRTDTGEAQLIGPDLGAGNDKYNFAAVGPDGHIYCPPFLGASKVLRIRGDTGDVQLIGPDLGDEDRKYRCAAVGPDGNIYCPPYGSGAGSGAKQVRQVLRIRTGVGQVDLIGPNLGRGACKYDCTVVGSNGNIYCPPNGPGANQVLVIRPNTEEVQLIGPNLGSGTCKYDCAETGRDGNIYCPPNGSGARQVLRICIASEDVQLIGPDLGPHMYKYLCAAVGSDGAIYCPPGGRETRQVLRICPSTAEVQLIGEDLGEGARKYLCARLGPDGHIYCPPTGCGATQVLRIRTDIRTVEHIGPELEDGHEKYHCAVLGPNSHIYCPPYGTGARQVLRIDPYTGEVQLIGPDLGYGHDKYKCAVLGSAGQIYCPPYDYGARQVLSVEAYLTLATSRLLRAYNLQKNDEPGDRSSFLCVARDLIHLFAEQSDGALDASRATEFVAELEAAVGPETEVKVLAAKYWTCGNTYPDTDRTFYSMVQEIFRREVEFTQELVDCQAKFCRAIARMLVKRGTQHEVLWPSPKPEVLEMSMLRRWGANTSDGIRTYRGTWMPRHAVDFYANQHNQNKWNAPAFFRAPGFLATSKRLEKAIEILTLNEEDAKAEGHVPVIIIVHIDGIKKTCQVNYLENVTCISGEAEFLFQAYSCFCVKAMALNPVRPTLDDPVVVEIAAHPDNVDAPLTLPLAKWF